MVTARAETEHRTLIGSTARQLGAYYTPSVAALHMARWALRTGDDRVLEPSAGDGQFVRAVKSHGWELDNGSPDVWGVEIARDTHDELIRRGVLPADRAIYGDFLEVKPFPVDVVIGNPPFVRLRHLSEVEASRARLAAERVLGRPMERDGSTWMPFVLHATQFLSLGGRLAFVLPHDATHVRYARPLWQYLASSFRTLRVVRVHERLFPDILQDVILLLADGHGGSTNSIEFEAFESVDDLSLGLPSVRKRIDVSRLVRGERVFVEALLAPELVDLLQGSIARTTNPVRDLASFNIGYVCGDKRFFHPSRQTVAHFQLPASSLLPTLASGRVARSLGMHTSSLEPDDISRLFLPPQGRELSTPESRYIFHGSMTGASDRYKCRVREPWYITPDVRQPDLLVPVFASKPILLINDAGLAASNSFLVGRLRTGTPERFAAAWYTTLTLLQVELEIHSLGGGVMILIPGETGSIRLAHSVPGISHLSEVDRLLRREQIDQAYAAGDGPILRDAMGLSKDETSLVAEGLETLRWWRTARDRHLESSVEDIPYDQPLLEGIDQPIYEGVEAHI